MKRALLLSLLAVCLTQPAFAEVRRFAVIVGNNEGSDGRVLRYAEDDARKMRAVVTELGGFRREDVALLLGQSADAVWTALSAMQRKVRASKSQPGQKTMTLFYYSGHADGKELELGKTSVAFEALHGLLRTSPADVRLALLDSCESGRLVTLKKAVRGPEFRIRLNDELSTSGYAILTSSAEDELSQESVDIRGSVFTHYFVSALRGAADLPKDGKVTLAEAYRHAYARTVARTTGTISGSQHPMYGFKLKGQGDIVLTRVNAQSRLRLSNPEGGRAIVLDAGGQAVVAESDLSDGMAELALAPGSYQVFLVRSGQVKNRDVHLRPGQSLRLFGSAFKPHALTRGVAKGGLFTRSVKHHLGLSGLVRSGPLADQGYSAGGVATYRMDVPSFGPVVRATWTKAPDTLASSGYFDLGLSAGGGVVHPWRSFRLRAAVLLGYEHMFQNRIAGRSRNTAAFTHGALFSMESELGPLFVAVEAAVGARLFKLHHEVGLVYRPDLQLALGLGWVWSR